MPVADAPLPTPKTRPSPLAALKLSGREDLRSGFLVSLIALPLCLGIAKASGCPPVAGLLTAIVGGLVASHIGSASLTIKGPAAGLIAIVLGAVTELTPAGADASVGYRRMLAVGVIAAVMQLGLAAFRAGKVADFFPSSVIHGLLASIGIIIVSKQIYRVIGVDVAPSAEPFELLAGLPRELLHANPEIAVVGATALAIMFSWPLLPKKVRTVPAQMVVVAVGILFTFVFRLAVEHDYDLGAAHYHISPAVLVRLPPRLLDAITFPDFSQIASPVTWKWVIMFTLIGSIESLASAKAVDALDPGHNRSNLDRDLFALGAGNLVAACIGGLPMISEIVRSSANIENGAKSSWSNFFHGAFLLLAVAAFPFALEMIPLAALGGMLVYTGLRLASPAGFKHAHEIGREQLAIFVFTLVSTLATDLLIGLIAGILLKFVIHAVRGVRPRDFFRLAATTEVDGDTTTIRVGGAAVFSNFLALRGRMLSATTPHVVVDLSDTYLTDHTTLERLEEMNEDLGTYHRTLEVRGLDKHVGVSGHRFATRRRAPDLVTASSATSD